MGGICVQILRLISMGLLVFCNTVAHANFLIKDGSLTLQTGDVLSVQNISIDSSGMLNGDISGQGTIHVSGNWDLKNGATFTHNNDSVHFVGSGESVISGANAFYALISDHSKESTTSGKTLKFEANSKQIIAHTLILRGGSNNLLTVTSSIAGEAAILAVSSAAINAEFLDISDSYLSGYSEYVNPQYSKSSNGNTLGWFPPSQIQVHEGDNQSAIVGEPVAIQPSVIIKDTYNNPLRDISVTFAVFSGGGYVLDESSAAASETTVTSNAEGIAQVGGWTLGNTVGTNTLAAAIDGDAGSNVVFTATAKAGMQTQIEVYEGDNQIAIVGSPVETKPSVIIKDVNDNPVPGISVTFLVSSGGGQVLDESLRPTSETTVISDAEGIARLDGWILGATPTTNTLTVAVDGLTDTSLIFVAKAISGTASPLTSTISASPNSIEADGISSSSITVQLRDVAEHNLNTGGSVVTLSTTAGHLSDITDNNNGTYSATLTSTTMEGLATITGKLDGESIVDSASVNFLQALFALIYDYHNGDGANLKKFKISHYSSAGISGVTESNLTIVTARILALAPESTNSVAKIQSLVDAVNKSSENELLLDPTIVVANDPDAAQVLEKYAVELASLAILEEADGSHKLINRYPSENVIIGTGKPGASLIHVDSNDIPVIYIIIKSSSGLDETDEFGKSNPPDQIFVWNPAKNTFKPVSIHFLNAKNNSHDVGDYIGYPLGEIALPDASNRIQLSGTTAEPNQQVVLWGLTDAEMLPVAGPTTSSHQPDNHGRYTWQMSAGDYKKPLDLGNNLVVAKSSMSLSLPLAIKVTAPKVNLRLASNRKQAPSGSIVTYTVQLENKSGYPVTDLAIRNDLPQGFKYVDNSARWDHDADAQTPMVTVNTSSHYGNKTLQFELGSISAATVAQTLRYQLRIGSGVNKGDYTNTVIAADHSGTPNTLSDDISLPDSQASVDIKVVEDALFELSTVIGKVFHDENGNGLQDPGDLPVPYARLVTSAGQQVTADANGQYHLANMRPGRMVVRIDERSLPEQTKILGHRSQIVDIRPGIPSKVNFAVQLSRVVDKDRQRQQQGEDSIVQNQKLQQASEIGGLQGEKLLEGSSQLPVFIQQPSEGEASASETEQLQSDNFEASENHQMDKSTDSVSPDQSENQMSNEIGSIDKLALAEGAQTETKISEQDAKGHQDKLSTKPIPNLKVVPKADAIAYQVPIVSGEFMAVQSDYDYTVQLHLGNDKKELLRIVSQYGESLEVSRFALLDMADHAGSRYALIYGLYKSSMQAKRALKKVSKVVRDNATLQHSLQVRPLKSMHKGQQAQRSVDELFVEKLGYVLKQINGFIFPKAYSADWIDSTILMTEAEAEDWLLQQEADRQSRDSGRAYSTSWSDFSVMQSKLDLAPRENRFTQPYLQQQTEDKITTLIEGNDNDLYNVPAIGVEFLLDQKEYSHTIELASSDDPKWLLDIAEDYKKSETISRFALLVVAQEDGNYTLIYGIYRNHREANLTLKGELPRALADSGALIRTIKSLQLSSRVVPDTNLSVDTSNQAEVVFEQTTDTQELPSTRDYFLVGIVDVEIAYRNIAGDSDLGKSGESRYRNKILKDGKVQLYFKGTVAGKYLVTASLDSERDSDDLFANLDSDANYALYGDSSTNNNLAAESDGALYLLVEKDTSWAKWGRLQAALNNSELASFQRSLQGAQLHYESTESSSHDDAATEIDAFYASTHQRASRVEFSATGSSVYYLKHQGVIKDSLKLKLEVRDSVSGNIRSSQTLVMGDDYQFNAQSGRIMFWESPQREVESALLMTGYNHARDKVYVVADYSYLIADDWSRGVSGAELQQALGNNIIVGISRIDEQKLDSDYSLNGVNSTVFISANHSLRLEYARSKSHNESQFYSDDGGLTWGSKTASSADFDIASGDAFLLHGQAELSEGRTNISYYGRSITEGFSSGYSEHFRGKKSFGFDVYHLFNEQLSARFKHHQQSELKNITTENDQSSSALQGIYDLSDRLVLTGEVQHLKESSLTSDNVALQGLYRFSEKTSLSLTQQSALNASNGGSQTRLGVHKKISDNLMIEGTLRNNTYGLYFGVSGDYSMGDKFSLGAGLEQDEAGLVSAQVGTGYRPNKDSIYRLSVDSSALENGKSSRGLSLGTEHRMSDSTSLSTGTSLSISGDNSRNSEDVKLIHKLANGREIFGSVTHYKHQGSNTVDDGHEISLGGGMTSGWQGFLTLGQGDLHRLEGILDKRRNLTIGANYVRPTEDQQKQLQGRLRYEVRQDRGMDNIDTTLLDINIKGRLNQDITLIAGLNWGQSKEADTDIVEAKNNRFDLSAAYRPLLKDNLNILGKYSWVEDKQPQWQIGDLGLESQQAHVLSGDILYDLNTKWSLGAKLSARHGEEKVQNLRWVDSRRWLMASRMGYSLLDNTKLYIEYRFLRDLRARDQKEGTVIELSQRTDHRVEVAIGVNYAGFSDDLGLMDYTEQRAYVRITGVLE